MDAPERPEPVPMPGLLATTTAVCVLGVVVVGVYPSPWVVMAQRVAATLLTI